MNEIADFDKPWTEMEKVPCVCGHARVFHEPRCCGMAACNKWKGFTPRPPELPTIAMMGAALGPRQMMAPERCSCGQTVVDCRRMLEEWMPAKGRSKPES